MAMLRVYKAVRPMAGFLNDEAPTSSAHTAELYATVRDDGRIVDDFRFNLGGSEFIEATFKLSAIFSDPELADWTVKIHTNPAEIKLRRNLFSGVWGDITALVASRDAWVLDKDGNGVPAAEFLRRVQESEEGPEMAAMRWAVMLTDSGRLVLHLHGLPASAAILNGKPSLKR